MKLDSDVPAGLLINFSTDGFLMLLDGFAFFFFFFNKEQFAIAAPPW